MERSSMGLQTRLFKVKTAEQRSICAICHGHRRLCGKAVCPILVKAASHTRLEQLLSQPTVYGASPPAVFIGSWNYPKVYTGPLVPPFSHRDTAIMDLPNHWVTKSLEQILQYRLALVRGKRFMNVHSAQHPDRHLQTFQELVMAGVPADTEMQFTKPPRLSITFSSREPPIGPSADLLHTALTQNPSTPRSIDTIVSDTDLQATPGIVRLYQSNIHQRQITRVFSLGLLGEKRHRKLVPTEWSITAIDDILGRALHQQIIQYPWINDYLIFGQHALANNVQILLFPSSWTFEAQEVWLTSPNPTPMIDYEPVQGRRTYATNLAGAYYAARLPVLEYLNRVRRQAGALVFMEVYPEWIPLGVWRFRELCREALQHPPFKCVSLSAALTQMTQRLRLPLQKWMSQSAILPWVRQQTRITQFLTSPETAHETSKL
jgi:hypothetical protein